MQGYSFFNWFTYKEKVMNVREDACKVTVSSIGLPADYTLENVKLFNHLTPKVQRLLVDEKNFKQLRRSNDSWLMKRISNSQCFRFCWCKNFIIYLRQTSDSRPIRFKTLKIERDPTFKLITLNFAT